MSDKLFDVPAVSSRKLPQRMGSMLRLYGPGPSGERCGTCAHLVRLSGYRRPYLKCALNRDTHGPATDWRAGWPACGKWEGGGA